MSHQPLAKPAAFGAQRSLAPRLQLKPEVPTTAYIDGGWWPRSSSLQVELPPLLALLAPVLGDVALVGYHLNAWDKAPSRVNIGDDVVLLQGFTANDPHSVVVVSHSGQRLTLLVVALESTELEAQAALSRAAEPVDDANGERENDEPPDRSLDEIASRLSLLNGITDNAHRATVEGWVSEAAQQFAHAPIQSYVPILVEHIVRGRIAAASLGASTRLDHPQ